MIYGARRQAMSTSTMQDRLQQVTQSSGVEGEQRIRPLSPLPARREEEQFQLAALLRRDGTPVLVISAGGDIGEVTIGRGDAVDVSLPESVVSQLHARLYWDVERGGHVLTDCGSTNGTYINRRRISGPVMLLNGMQIRLGTVVLSYRCPYQTGS
jgi:hypothetical protein